MKRRSLRHLAPGRLAGWLALLGALLAPSSASAANEDDDPYASFLRATYRPSPSPTQPGRWTSFVYMPWRYQWTVGTGEAGGRVCRELGINGGVMDHGRGPLEWLEEWNLQFYNDHTAGKGILFLGDDVDREGIPGIARDPDEVRPVPLDEASLDRARALVRRNLTRVKESPLRRAYALDDEVSWGVFVKPLAWRVNEDDAAYQDFLSRIHGRPVDPRFVGPDFVRKQLGRRPLAEIDLSPFLDRMTYNDLVLAEFVGELAAEAHRVDPETPCGIVGMQTPNLFGGYDYARLMPKLHFVEVYDQGSAPEIARSLRSSDSVPMVSTHFHRGAAGYDSWFAWSRFAHGERGLIGWVEGWFDGEKPAPWLLDLAPTLRELTGPLGEKTASARFRHDGIALYYSHPSIQVGWCLDAQAHGSSWPNRNRDHLLGTTHRVRKAWERILNDGGLQYDFVGYDEVVRSGVPAEYRVLVLPSCFALSDAEAARIREFVDRGGRVVADFMCGLFDQHGRGRTRGALDDLFGITHDGSERAEDFFAEDLWVETDQDEGYDFFRHQDLSSTLDCPTRGDYAAPELRLEGPYENGDAVYLNLSPQRYLELRERGRVDDARRTPFLAAIGVEPWVRAIGGGNFEVTYFEKDGRLLLFVFQSPTIFGNEGIYIGTGATTVRLEFAQPVQGVRDERSGEELGDGQTFRVTFERSQAAFLSLDDPR